MSSKTPHGTANTAGRFAYQGLVLTGLELFLKPLADVVADHTRCDPLRLITTQKRPIR